MAQVQDDAVQGVLEVLRSWTHDAEPASTFTCDETDALAEFVRVFGIASDADALVRAHAVGDTDEENRHTT